MLVFPGSGAVDSFYRSPQPTAHGGSGELGANRLQHEAVFTTIAKTSSEPCCALPIDDPSASEALPLEPPTHGHEPWFRRGNALGRGSSVLVANLRRQRSQEEPPESFPVQYLHTNWHEVIFETGNL